MLEKQLPSNLNRMVRPSYPRVAGIARGLDLPDDRSGRRAHAADLPSFAASPPMVPLAVVEGQATGWWWAAIAFFMEGFALYGASLYPSAIYSVDEALLPSHLHQARLADSRHGTVQSLAAQSLNGSNVISPGLAAWSEPRPSKGGDWLGAVGAKIAAVWTHWRRESEIRQAVQALSEYDDRTLLDLGICGRADIERMVRYCRDC